MVPHIQHLVSLSILLPLFNPWARSEFFTATAGMELLLETHKRIIDDLDDYITKEEKRLAFLKNHLEEYKVEHKEAMEDIPKYFGNPINEFTLIKRLTIDLDEIKYSIKNGPEYIYNVSMNQKHVLLPTLADLAGAVQALTRLQVTYNLDVHDLAEGKLHGVSYTHPMAASDCIEIFRTLYFMEDYKHALPWSMEGLRKYKAETTEEHSFTEVDVLEHIAFTHYKLGELKSALEWSKKLLELDPVHPAAKNNVPYFEKAISEEETATQQGLFSCINAFIKTALEWSKELLHLDFEDVQAAVNAPHIENAVAEQEAAIKKPGDGGLEFHNFPMTGEYAIIKTKYEALCRGEMEINSGVAKRLFCRYMSETHPFLRLAPIKAEQVYIDPDVFVFHGVLSDDEIQVIKDLSMPRLEPAVVHDLTTGKFLVANYRVCKSALLRDEESPVVARVSQRVADMTGLSMESAEELLVVNYGIGGHYEPHFDFFEKKHFNNFKLPRGNRVATVLFYMSDVAQGGATVFTELGLAVFPARGAALYWRNLHPSGEGDTATRHAACPVLRGSKWVCAKWLHEVGQELIKPCNLEYQREEMVRNIPAPYRNRRDRLSQFKNN